MTDPTEIAVLAYRLRQIAGETPIVFAYMSALPLTADDERRETLLEAASTLEALASLVPHA